MPKRIVPACAIALIQRFEGLHDGDKSTPNILEPQADPIGIYTVGWGFALFQNGKPVKDKATAMKMWRERWPAGMTRADADELLRQVAQEVCDKVMRLVGSVAIRDGELGAMISLAYNIDVGEKGGAPDFADSTVLRKFLAGDRAGAADAFLMWKFAGGRELAGLVNRRTAERLTFLGQK